MADEVCSVLMGDDVEHAPALHPDQRQGRAVPRHLRTRAGRRTRDRTDEYGGIRHTWPERGGKGDGGSAARVPTCPSRTPAVDRAHRDPRGDGALVPRVLHVGHRVAGPARRPRRPQAGAPPDPLLDVRARTSGPTGPHAKCAKVVGEVMGNFHPHGDIAIYDALARMAQDFSLRHPLIDGHGNFGGTGPTRARRPCATPSAGWPRWPWRCWPASTRTPSTSSPTTTARPRSPSCCRRGSPTCSSTARRASRWAWPPTSRPTTWARSSTPPSTCSSTPRPPPTTSCSS